MSIQGNHRRSTLVENLGGGGEEEIIPRVGAPGQRAGVNITAMNCGLIILAHVKFIRRIRESGNSRNAPK